MTILLWCIYAFAFIICTVVFIMVPLIIRKVVHVPKSGLYYIYGIFAIIYITTIFVFLFPSQNLYALFVAAVVGAVFSVFSVIYERQRLKKRL
jgi:hypothetical protein